MSKLAARFPARRMAMTLVRRGLLLWMLARAMLLAVGMALGAPASIAPVSGLRLALAVGGRGVLESRRLNEHRFLSNLGVSAFTASLLIMAPALIAEIVIAVVLWQ